MKIRDLCSQNPHGDPRRPGTEKWLGPTTYVY